MKQACFSCVVYLIMATGLTRPGWAADDQKRDHLVPLSSFFTDSGSMGNDYWTLVRKKLFVTRGEIARFAMLSGVVGNETATSIYRDREKKGGLPGGYWLTATQSHERLWDCIPQGKGKVSDQGTVTIGRCDVPLAESTAVAIHEAWLAMLAGIRPAPENEIGVDNGTEIYSATNAAGVTLQGTGGGSPGKKTSALFRLALSLVEHCFVSQSEPGRNTREIEKAAEAIRRMASTSRTKK